MKNLTVTAVAVALLVPMMMSSAVGQEAMDSQILWISNDKVMPAKAKEYEAALKDWFTLFGKHKFGSPIYVSVGLDSSYNFLLPMPDYATMDKNYGWYDDMLAKEAERSNAIRKRLGAANLGEDVWLVKTRPDLSYIPENPRLGEEDVNFILAVHVYVKAGSEAEYENALIKIVKFYKDRKLRDGFLVGYAITGTDLPLYAINIYGKSAADFWTQDDKRRDMGGTELQALIDEANSVVWKLETLDLTPRPDLSYMPK